MPKFKTPLTLFFTFPGYLVWIAIAYGLGLWELHPLLTGDQKVYLNVVLEMSERGDWIMPWLFGEHNFIKPPFLYWMILGSWKFFGVSWFSTHLPGVLALLGTCFFLGKIGGHFKIAKTENVAPLVFAGCFGTLTYSLSIQMEIWLTLLITGAWYAWLRFEERKSLLWGLVSFSWAGLLCVVKSPLHFALWIAGLVVYLVFSGRLRFLRSFRAWLSLLMGTALGLAWYGIVAIEAPAEFTAQYLNGETLGKSAGNGGTALNMWGDTLVSWLPLSFLLGWSLLRLAAMLWAILPQPTTDHRQKWALSFGWCLAPLVFFSYFPYRTETYLFVVLPALALLVNQWRWNPLFLWIHRVILMLLIICALVAGIPSGMAGLVSWELVLCLVGVTVIYNILFWNGNLIRGLIGLQGILTIVHLILNQVATSDFNDVRAALKLGQLAKFSGLVMLDEGRGWWNERGVLSIALDSTLKRTDTKEQFYREILAGSVGILNSAQAPGLKSELLSRTDLKVTPWLRWNRAFTFPTPAYLERLSNKGSEEWNRIYRREYILVQKSME